MSRTHSRVKHVSNTGLFTTDQRKIVNEIESNIPSTQSQTEGMLGGEPRTEGPPDKLPKHRHTRLAAPVPRPLDPEPEWWWIHRNGDPERSALYQSDMTSGSTRTSKSDDRTLSPTPPLTSPLPPTMPGPSHDRDQIVSVAIYPDKDSPRLLCVDGQRRFSACPSVQSYPLSPYSSH